MTWKIGVPDAETGLVLKMMPGQTPYTEEELKLLFGIVHDSAVAEITEDDELAMGNYWGKDQDE